MKMDRRKISEKEINLALLIDGDNATQALGKDIIGTVSMHGKPTIRRVYGDWTLPSNKSWQFATNKYSLKPIQNFAYTGYKNSTDIALIIDAMDILYSKKVEGFCLVSSDSDFTGLAKRIREEGFFMMGIGNRQTHWAFQNACEEFLFFDQLNSIEYNNHIEETDYLNEPLSSHLEIIDRAYKKASIENDTEVISLSTLGTKIREIDPTFDSRKYGQAKFNHLIKTIPKFQLLVKDQKGLKEYSVRLRKTDI